MRFLVVGSDGREHAGEVLAQRYARRAAAFLQVPALVLSAVAVAVIAPRARSGAGAVR